MPLTRIILGEIDLLSDATNRTLNAVSVDDRLLSKFYQLFYSLIGGTERGLDAYFAPVSNLHSENVSVGEDSNDIYTSSLINFGIESASTGLISYSEKPTAPQVDVAKKLSERYADLIYNQLMRMVNYTLNNELNNWYKWEFKVFGGLFTDKDREEQLRQGLSIGHKELTYDYLAMHGKSVVDAIDEMQVLDVLGLYDMLEPVTSSYQNTGAGDSGEVGRPAAEPDEIESDSTEMNVNNKEEI